MSLDAKKGTGLTWCEEPVQPKKGTGGTPIPVTALGTDYSFSFYPKGSDPARDKVVSAVVPAEAYLEHDRSLLDHARFPRLRESRSSVKGGATAAEQLLRTVMEHTHNAHTCTHTRIFN